MSRYFAAVDPLKKHFYSPKKNLTVPLQETPPLERAHDDNFRRQSYNDNL